MIRRKRADTYVYRLWCDVCGNEMRPDGGALTSSPPQYIHRCTAIDCDHTETPGGGRRYPIVDTVEIHEEVLNANDQKEPDNIIKPN
jgi:hypothetical protein